MLIDLMKMEISSQDVKTQKQTLFGVMIALRMVVSLLNMLKPTKHLFHFAKEKNAKAIMSDAIKITILLKQLTLHLTNVISLQ